MNDINTNQQTLGAIWSKERTIFRLWSPSADQIILCLYHAGSGVEEPQTHNLTKDAQGVWETIVQGDCNGLYYTYRVVRGNDEWEVVDPYAKALGVNGNRGMVIDLSVTNPEGFLEGKKPVFHQPTDAVIYELHVRDFSIDSSSGMKQKGKYLAFTEEGTKNTHGDITGIDHIKELGVTHVHLIPVFDYASIDEDRLEEMQFNWGYDPKNYNAPEGSYSSNPYEGSIRIKEFKQMIQMFHQKGLRVVMDVVYNHTMDSENSNFHKIEPGYYYRMTEDGKFSDASACGNETASERTMVRKFIIDSVVYWAKEYHIDGFRFDLMGIHDIETMNMIRAALDEIDPSILLYGEGWTGGASTLQEDKRALKANMPALDSRIAAFSDDIRDGIKGSVFYPEEQGFISGKNECRESIKFGVVASTMHSQVNYEKVNYSNKPWANEPTQTITYASAHDNYSLWDKIRISNPEDDEEVWKKRNLLSAAIVFTSQGIPFFQAGEEFLRSKPMDEASPDEKYPFVENSYKSSDRVNSLKWDSKTTYQDVYSYYHGLIQLRKKYQLFRLTTTNEIQQKLHFLEEHDSAVIAYQLDDGKQTIIVIYNASNQIQTVLIPENKWEILVKDNKAGIEVLETLQGGSVTVSPISAMVLVANNR